MQNHRVCYCCFVLQWLKRGFMCLSIHIHGCYYVEMEISHWMSCMCMYLYIRCESELWLTLPIIIMHITEWIKATSGSWANVWHCFKYSRFWTSLRQHSRIEYMPQKPKWPSYAIGSHRQRQRQQQHNWAIVLQSKNGQFLGTDVWFEKKISNSLPPVQSVVHLIFHMLGNCVLYCFFAVVFI